MGSDPMNSPHEVRDLILDGVRRVGTTGLGDLGSSVTVHSWLHNECTATELPT